MREATILVAALTLAGCTCAGDDSSASSHAPAEEPSLERSRHRLSEEEARSVVARIDDREITALDFADEVASLRGQRRARAVAPAERAALLERLLDEELLADEARRRGHAGNPRVIAARREALRRVLVAAADEAPRPEDVSPVDLRARYEAEPTRWRGSERVRARAILVADRELAESILRELTESEHVDRDMQRLFDAHSLARAGFPPEGRFGPFASPEQARSEDAHVPVELARAAFETQAGQLHGRVVESGGAFYIVRTLTREPATDIPFELAREQLAREIAEERFAARLEARALRGRAVRVDEVALARVEIPGVED